MVLTAQSRLAELETTLSSVTVAKAVAEGQLHSLKVRHPKLQCSITQHHPAFSHSNHFTSQVQHEASATEVANLRHQLSEALEKSAESSGRAAAAEADLAAAQGGLVVWQVFFGSKKVHFYQPCRVVSKVSLWLIKGWENGLSGFY